MEYDKLMLIQDRAEDLLDEMKNDENIGVLSNALYILVGLSIACTIFIYIRSDISIELIIYLILIISVFIFYRIKMQSALRQNAQLAVYKEVGSDTKGEYVKGLLRYLASGINVKQTRSEAVRMAFVIVFPIFLMMISDIFFRPSSISLYFVNLAVAALLGSGFWYIYFSESIREYQEDKEEVESLMTRLSL